MVNQTWFSASTLVVKIATFAKPKTNSRVTYVDDLYKLLHNEFSNEEDRMELLQQVGTKTEMEIQGEIKLVEEELKMEAYKNFYQLLLSNKIELA